MRRLRLGDAVEIKHGYAFSGAHFSEDVSYPTVLTPGNFAIGGGFRRTRPKTFSGVIPAGYELEPGSLIVTMTDLSKSGDTLGLPAIVPGGERYLHNQRIGLVQVRDNTLIHRDFLAYYLRTKAYREHVLGTATGSTVKHTSPSRIEAFVGEVPELGAQRAITEVLTALDDKIAANDEVLRLSDHLVRAMFVSLDDASTESLPIAAVAENVRVQVDPSEVDPSVPYVGLEHVPRRSMWMSDIGVAGSVSSAKARFRTGDVLFGKLRPYFHKVVRADRDGIASTDILVVRAKDPILAGFVLAAASSDVAIRATSAAVEGTRMPRTKWTDLAAVTVPWPGEAAAIDFSAQVAVLCQHAAAMQQESRVLAETRDELLPLLMSGKVRVRDAEKRVEEVL